MVKYELNNNFGLLNPPYPAYNFAQLDPLPIQKTEDKDFIDDFLSTTYICHVLFFDRYI